MFMGKRSDFDRLTRDFYATIDPKALPETFLECVSGSTYAEPCYGNGDLVRLIGDRAECLHKSDIEGGEGCQQLDGTKLTYGDIWKCNAIVTNPPYKRTMLDPLLDQWLTVKKPIWLLLPADYMHNITFGKYMEKCSKVVSVGRLFWFKSVWVVNEQISLDSRPDWCRDGKHITSENHEKGTLGYTGWWDNSKGSPTKTETTRGTDNYAWFCFEGGHSGGTTFYGR